MSIRGGGYETSAQRVRTGLIVLLAGLVVLLAALGMMMLLGPRPGADRTSNVEQTHAPDPDTSRQIMAAGMILLIALSAMLLAAGYALFRVTRRYTLPRSARPGRPTADEDVWKMHKPPPEEPLPPPPDSTL